MALLITSCEGAFVELVQQMVQMTDYLNAVVPVLSRTPKAIRPAAESAIVLLVAWHEHFLGGIITAGVRYRQSDTRAFLAERSPKEREALQTCDLATLFARARRQVSFQKRGLRFEQLFTTLYGFSPWSDDAVQNQLVDLNLARQLIVHSAGVCIGDGYWNQFSDKTLLDARQYGDLPAVRRLAYPRLLLFLRDAIDAVVAQSRHIRKELFARPEWVYKPGDGVR